MALFTKNSENKLDSKYIFLLIMLVIFSSGVVAFLTYRAYTITNRPEFLAEEIDPYEIPVEPKPSK